jgi:hypothetical protein
MPYATILGLLRGGYELKQAEAERNPGTKVMGSRAPSPGDKPFAWASVREFRPMEGRAMVVTLL